MLRKKFLYVFLIYSVPALAQAPPEANVGFESIRAGDMRAVLSFLASDALEGRETGERGLDIAARFLETQFSLNGLTPAPGSQSMLQKFDLVMTQVTDNSIITMQTEKTPEQPYHWLKDFYGFNLGATTSAVQGEVVFVGYGISAPEEKWDDYKNLDIRDKVVLLLSARGLNSVQEGKLAEVRTKLKFDNNRQTRTAQEKGARAALIIGPASIPDAIKEFRRFIGAPRMSLAQTPARESGLPNLVISEGMADALLSSSGETAQSIKEKIIKDNEPMSRKLGKTFVKINIETRQWPALSQNVVACLEGSDPILKNQFVVFSAHYDHLGKRDDGTIFNGADDDGSGTTALVELAQAFAGNPIRPKRSLLFIAHAGEEKGLLGSEHFTSNPLVPLENIATNLNIDMIGRNDSNSVYIIGSDHLSSELHQINEDANKAIGLNFDYTYNDVNDPNRFYYRSDHYNFAKHGIPIIFYFTGTHEDYHRPGDDVEKINFDKMQKITRLIYLTGWQAANLDHKLIVDRTPPESEEIGGGPSRGMPRSRQ
jgi:hypothetical protein